MNKIWALGFALLLGASMFAGSAIPAWAEEQSMAQSACTLDMSWKEPVYASELFGALVLDQNREGLGRVVGVTFENGEDMTNFIIVSSCLPGRAEELVAIPFKGYPYSPSEGTLTLGLSKEDFANAPVYSGILEDNWAQKAFEYWEGTPYFG